MKKQFTQLCIAMAILLSISTSSKAQATLYFDTINNVCTVGSTVSIPLRIKNFNSIMAYQGTVKFDTAVLKYKSAVYGSVDSVVSLDKYSVYLDSISNGQIGILWVDPNPSGTGETEGDTSILATFNFTVKKLIVGNTPINFEVPNTNWITSSIVDTVGGGRTIPNSVFTPSYINFVSQPTISKSGTLLTAVASGVPSGYQWSFNGSPISGETNVSYNFGDVPGSYAVTVNYSNGCTATSAPLLPVSIKNFTGNYKDGAANLSWSFANENAAYFNVQVSSNGKDFVTIKKVTASGSSYNFSDANGAANSKVYYRLQVVENDGSFTYSNVVALSLSNATSFSIYPNPVRNNLSLLVQSSKTELVSIQVVDLLGKVLHQEPAQLSIGLNHVSFNVASLSKGNYVVVLKGASSLQQQFIKY